MQFIFANDVEGWSVAVVGWALGEGGRVEGKGKTTEILPNNFADFMLLRMRYMVVYWVENIVRSPLNICKTFKYLICQALR